jgi:hypothetical protein
MFSVEWYKWMIEFDEHEQIWKEAVVAYPKVLARHSWKTRENLSQDSRCPDRDLNRALLEWKSEMLPFQSACLVKQTYKQGC